MNELKFISERISYSESEKKFVMAIIPYRNTLYMYLLFFWLLAWTVAGIYIMLQSVYMPDKKYKIFSFIYFFFWIYFEWMAVRVFHWRKWGKEVLVAEKGRLMYEKRIFFKVKKVYLDLNLIGECKVIPLDEKKWSDFFTTSYWHIGKERMEISAGPKKILFGYQLSNDEALKASKMINRRINSEHKKSPESRA
ncbi:MAG: hypothetical protein N3F09_00570 [Bacteroidia bacterium]|nr:hypothetical protein [Bacteroidia bacterium]